MEEIAVFGASRSHSTRRGWLAVLGAGVAAMLASLTVCAPPAGAGAVLRDVPAEVDPQARYLFYLHGLAVEQGGRRADAYDYAGILSALAKSGFQVIGEERGRVRPDAYAEKVAAQVRRLLASGVPAKNVTVAGHSKGGLITMLVMATLAEPEVAYVNFAGCGLEGSGFEGHLRFAQRRASQARGRLLSAYERSDRIAGTCRVVLERMTDARVEERVLEVGGGHELFYAPDPSWLDPLRAWAERRDE